MQLLHLITALSLGAGLAVANAPAPRTAPAGPSVQTPELDDAILAQATLGAPVVAGNVAVFPLVAKAGVGDDVGDVLTLDEALESGDLTIRETDESGTVNTLHVTNKAQKPIYLASGEVLLGGKQDRVVGRNMLVPQGAKDHAVPVFCVEQGRWQHKTARFESAKVMAHTKLRRTANTESQGKVWQEVAATNAVRATENATDTYRDAAKKALSEGAVKERVATLRKGTAAHPRTAGVVVAINGQPTAVDWFASPKLYRRLEAKLLTSYVTQGHDAADGKDHSAPGASDVTGFLKQADEARSSAARAGGEGDVLLYDDEAVDGQAIYAPAKAGAKPKALHKTYYKK